MIEVRLKAITYRKLASNRLSRLVHSIFKDFQTIYEGEIRCLSTVNFGQKSSNLTVDRRGLLLATIRYVFNEL